MVQIQKQLNLFCGFCLGNFRLFWYFRCLGVVGFFCYIYCFMLGLIFCFIFQEDGFFILGYLDFQDMNVLERFWFFLLVSINMCSLILSLFFIGFFIYLREERLGFCVFQGIFRVYELVQDLVMGLVVLVFFVRVLIVLSLNVRFLFVGLWSLEKYCCVGRLEILLLFL